MPVMIPVVSSNVARVGYSQSSSDLYVEFTSGATYVYLGVPCSVFDELLTAASKGRYLNAMIKPFYQCREL